MSKGQQAIEQIFIYALSGIIVIMVLVYGYNAIKDFREKSEQVADIKFQKNLEEAFNRLYSNYGSKIQFDDANRLEVPTKYKQICFAETDSAKVPAGNIDSYPLLRTSVCGSPTAACKTYYNGSCTPSCNSNRDNVFPVIKDMERSFYIPKMNVEPNQFFCVNVTNGHINIRLESLGRQVKVSKLS